VATNVELFEADYEAVHAIATEGHSAQSDNVRSGVRLVTLVYRGCICSLEFVVQHLSASVVSVGSRSNGGPNGWERRGLGPRLRSLP
jgi:hypothetical protein